MHEIQLSAIFDMQDESMSDEDISDCRDKAVMRQYYSDGRIMHGLFWSHLNEKLNIKFWEID